MSHPFRALISPLQTQCDLVRIAFIIIATKLHAAKDAERGAEIFRVTKSGFLCGDRFLYVPHKESVHALDAKRDKRQYEAESERKAAMTRKSRIVPLEISKIGVFPARFDEIERNLQEISEKTMAL